jgi:hypothetical protein
MPCLLYNNSRNAIYKDVMNEPIQQKTIDLNGLLLCKSILERKYDYAYNTPDKKAFLIGVSDYSEAIEKSDFLRNLVYSTIIEKRKVFTDQIDELTQKTTEEAEETFIKICEILVKNNIKNADIDYRIDQYKGYRDRVIQPISGFGNYGTWLVDEVNSLLWSLQQSGYEDIIKDFCIYDRNKMLRDFKISDSDEALRKLIRKFEEEQETTIWGDWNKLNLAYVAIHLKDEFFDNFTQKNEQQNRFNFAGLAGEMTEIMGGKVQRKELRVDFFNQEKFKYYLKRVHYHLISEIDSCILSEQASAEPKTTEAIEEVKKEEEIIAEPQKQSKEKWYIPETGVGLIRDKKFGLTDGGNKYKLFNALIEKRKLQRSEIIDLLSLPKDDDNKYTRTANTTKINGLVTELRKTTKLTSTELLLSGGNITLATEIEIRSFKIT